MWGGNIIIDIIYPQNLYRNVDQFIGQAMEVNNDLEDFVNQESRSGKGKGIHELTIDMCWACQHKFWGFNNLTVLRSSKLNSDNTGQRVSSDNFKSYRSAKMYNTTFSEAQGKDKMYFNRSVDKSLRSKR